MAVHPNPQGCPGCAAEAAAREAMLASPDGWRLRLTEELAEAYRLYDEENTVTERFDFLTQLDFEADKAFRRRAAGIIASIPDQQAYEAFLVAESAAAWGSPA